MFIHDGLPQTNEAARRLVNARSAKMASRAKATFIRCRKCQVTRTPYRIRPHGPSNGGGRHGDHIGVPLSFEPKRTLTKRRRPRRMRPEGGDQGFFQTQLAILPIEALHASRQIRSAGCSQQEKARLGALVPGLQTLVTRATVLVSRRPILPEITKTTLRRRFGHLEVEFKQMLNSFAECIRQGDCRRKLPILRRALDEMDGALESVRQSETLKDQELEAPVHVLDLVIDRRGGPGRICVPATRR
jgi:hypothetical protein